MTGANPSLITSYFSFPFITARVCVPTEIKKYKDVYILCFIPLAEDDLGSSRGNENDKSINEEER